MAQAGYTSVRSCDDFVILCRTQAEAEAALALVHAWIGSSPQKSSRIPSILQYFS